MDNEDITTESNQWDYTVEHLLFKKRHRKQQVVEEELDEFNQIDLWKFMEDHYD